MKARILMILAAVMLIGGLAGCGSASSNTAKGMLQAPVDAVKDAVETVAQGAGAAMSESTGPRLTAEEARNIALEHAGFTADQVTYLRTEYEIDDGVPQYEVDFHQGRWEYDYEINAETGEILYWNRDD